MTETILITGNGGFIGSYIEKTLSDRYNTVGLSREEGYDITDFNSLKKIESKLDIIVHAAAIASDDYETYPKKLLLRTVKRTVLTLQFSDLLKFMMMPDWHKVVRLCSTTLLTLYKRNRKSRSLVVVIH